VLRFINKNFISVGEDSINQQQVNQIEIRDNSKRAKLLLYVFYALIGITLLNILTGYNELRILKNAEMGFFVSESEAEFTDLMQGIAGLLGLIVYITSVVVFIMWFRRAYGNLHRMGISYLKNTESMAVWTWFVPFINLYKPFQIMSEIWLETQEKIKKLDAEYIIKSGTLLIALWWSLFLISGFLGRYVLQTSFKDETLEQLILHSEMSLYSDILEVPEALLVILIVLKISKMEVVLKEKVEASLESQSAD